MARRRSRGRKPAGRPFATEIILDPDGTVSFRNLTADLAELARRLRPDEPRLARGEPDEHPPRPR